ncbi:MAG TPA: PEP-CTERM sorting domain-containing protein [Sedimentisphaerales bacterium]|nr:PEP-CTERM sorting domain-containing protein [Sedimentisphaerales bacterium]
MKGNHFFRLLLAFCLLMSAAECKAVTVTYFPQTNIGGGIQGSATATITSGPGYLDILLTNTSPLGPDIPPEGIANPFITEIEFKYLDGFTLNEVSSYVSSLADSLFAQGAGYTAVNYPIRNLYYDVVAADHAGMDRCFMTANADNIRNDNTIASASVLDAFNIPQEGHAVGFLDKHPDDYSAAVFDTVLFHFVFDETAVPDTSFYANPDTLVVKFVGGGDYSLHVPNVPEPSSVVLIGLGAVAALKRRSK